MSKALRTIGKVAGLVASVAQFVPGAGQIVAAVASGVALVANIGAALTAKKPPVLGSSTTITIGANQPTPMIIGESYCGGARVAQEAYGTASDVPNAYALFVDVHSAGGPLNALVGQYTDFNSISFSSGNAVGYYHNYLYCDTQLGATPEGSALAQHFGTPANWGASYKLSGYAAILWNARWPKDGKLFAAGFPQTGAVWQGVLTYDPRLDDTYPGGSGSHRWADPINDATGFASAKATWAYNPCPGLNGLRYALGTWERASGGDPFVQTYGMGLPIDSIVVADFVELANVCDANGWTCNGVIYEPGDTWANLKRIVAAGGAEPVWKGARLGLRIRAPRVSLATIGTEDLAGEAVAPAMQSYRNRFNTLTPVFRDPGQKWEYAPTTTAVQVTDYVTEDGEVREATRQWDLVTDPNQAAQLTGYDLVDSREAGPIELVLKSEWRIVKAGEQYAISAALAARLGLTITDLVVTNRRFDPVSCQVTLTLMTENNDKHAYALGLTGSSPPAVSIVPPEDIDGAVHGNPAEISAIIRQALIKLPSGTSFVLSATDAGSDATITVAAHSWDYPNREDDQARVTGSITGLAFSTKYFVYFDDSTMVDDTPTYVATTDHSAALNSTANPFRHFLGSVTTPANGGGDTDGGDDGGGGYCPVADTMFLRTREGAVAAGDVTADMEVWGRHEDSGKWGWWRVAAVSLHEEPCFAVTIAGQRYETSGSHPFWIAGGWAEAARIEGAMPIGLRAVARISVAEAHTYLLLPSRDAAGGVLSHNKAVEEP